MASLSNRISGFCHHKKYGFPTFSLNLRSKRTNFLNLTQIRLIYTFPSYTLIRREWQQVRQGEGDQYPIYWSFLLKIQ